MTFLRLIFRTELLVVFLAAGCKSDQHKSPKIKPTVVMNESPEEHRRSANTMKNPAKRSLGVIEQPLSMPSELGEGLLFHSFKPGTYLSKIEKSLTGTHARNWVRESAKMWFTLSVDKNGNASACRAKDVRSTNDGPSVHNSENLREQQGYRGQWGYEKGWIKVDLTPDNKVCPQVRAYTNLTPGLWHLRCLYVKPDGHPLLSVPALVCQGSNKDFTYQEDWGHFVPGVFPKEWLILGTGNGLRIIWTDSKVPPAKAQPNVIMEIPKTPILFDLSRK